MKATTLLAAYLDQRLRMGEPALFPKEPGLDTRARAAAGANAGGGGSAGRPPNPSQRRTSGKRPERSGPRHRPAATESATLPVVPAGGADYSELRAAALACTRCPLSEERTQVVFSDGNPQGRLMVVGEAPGAREDATGLPFVGPAGKLLDLMLASAGLSRRESVYICNVLKCRPPNNRNPLPDEIDSCAPLLKRQIELVKPEVILAAGTFAARWLTSSPKPLVRLRGKVYSYQGVPLVVTYHPAALLRNPGWNLPAWNDLQLLCQVLDGK